MTVTVSPSAISPPTAVPLTVTVSSAASFACRRLSSLTGIIVTVPVVAVSSELNSYGASLEAIVFSAGIFSPV